MNNALEFVVWGMVIAMLYIVAIYVVIGGV